MKQTTTIFLLVFALLLSACRGEGDSAQDLIDIHPELKNIPVYPESTAWMEGIPGVDRTTEKYQTYSYSVKTIEYESIADFYEEEMPILGWELMSKDKDSKTRSAGLMFAKPNTVAHIQMMPLVTGYYLVFVVFYDDSVFEE